MGNSRYDSVVIRSRSAVRGLVVGEHRREQRGAGHSHDGRAGKEDHREAQQALRVGLAPVNISGTGTHEQRHHHAREHPAEEQFVDHAREGVGEAVVVSDRDHADGRADGRGADETGDPAGDAAQRHDRAVLGDRGTGRPPPSGDAPVPRRNRYRPDNQRCCAPPAARPWRRWHVGSRRPRSRSWPKRGPLGSRHFGLHPVVRRERRACWRCRRMRAVPRWRRDPGSAPHRPYQSWQEP